MARRMKAQITTPKREAVEFETSTGTVFVMKPIPAGLLMVFANEADKPEVPKEAVRAAGGVISYVPDEDDPQYKKDLAAWEGKRTNQMLRLAVLMGIANDPPADDQLVRQLRYIDDGIDSIELKFQWAMGNLPHEEEIGQFIEFAFGQTTITEEGLAESSSPERFRADGERNTRPGMAVQEGTAAGEPHPDPLPAS
jgi:hypothetical protein